MQIKLDKLELPRSRAEIAEAMRLHYATNTTFFRRVNSILSVGGFKDEDKIIAREILLFGEALVVNDLIQAPETYRVKVIPKKGRVFYTEAMTLFEGYIQYYSKMASPYDCRGTSFFNSETLEPYNDRSDSDIACHLILILDSVK
jgi:hypothetical protein